MRPSNSKSEQHAKVDADLKAFLENGGQIQQCTSDENAYHRKESNTKRRQREFSIRQEQQ